MPFENIVRKGDNASNQHSFPFKKTFSLLPLTLYNIMPTFNGPGPEKLSLKVLHNGVQNQPWGQELTLYHKIITLPALYRSSFENTVGKGENADDQHFLLFPQYFLSFPKLSIFQLRFILMSANVFNLDQSKILRFGKQLKE